MAPLPAVPVFKWDASSLLDAFTARIEAAHGKVVVGHDINAAIRDHYPDALNIASPLSDVIVNIKLDPSSPRNLAPVDLAIIKGDFGVAENGAIWVPEKEMGVRALPFIAQHLMIVLDRSRIVGTMHEAYEQMKGTSFGFGVFIAGPSKTADIEQILVMGAHGPKTLTVVIFPSPRRSEA